MDQDILKTDVDDFIELVREKEKISVDEAAKTLGVDKKTVESWADFLVEEKILGMVYKFTTPYVFIAGDDEKNSVADDFETKDSFFEKAKAKKVPEHHIKVLWLKYLDQNEKRIKAAFIQRAKNKGFSDKKVEELWDKYYHALKVD